MQHNILRPRQALNKAYLRLKTSRSDMEGFKSALRTLLGSIDLGESEEHVKNHLRDFLKTAFYKKYGINTKEKTHLVIHVGPDTKSQADISSTNQFMYLNSPLPKPTKKQKQVYGIWLSKY